MSGAFGRALGANLCWAIGVGVLERRKTLAEATAVARDLVRVHGCMAYVYRRPDGSLFASILEPALWPEAELVTEIIP